MHQITLRFKAEEYDTVQALVDAWLNDQPVTIGVQDGRKADFRLTYVRSIEKEN